MVSDDGTVVALLAEGVDRNNGEGKMLATIEVALLAEGVDRNLQGVVVQHGGDGRPPRGGRG